MPCGMPHAHEDLLDERRVHVRVALEQLVDDEGAHLVGAQLGQRALEGAADGRADGVDDHCFGHSVISLAVGRKVRGTAPQRRYRGGIRSAPSRRMVSPLSIWFSAIWQARRAYSSGWPSLDGKGSAPERLARLLGQRGQSGVSNRPGAIVHTRMPRPRQVARGGQRHPRDAGLRGGVGDLADLAVEGRDRGGHHHRAALAVLVLLVLVHRGGREPQHVERADQVHPHDGLERQQLVRAVLADGALGPADARAGHREAEAAEGLDRRGHGGLPRPRSVTSQCSASAASPSSPASASAFSSSRRPRPPARRAP